MDIFNKKNIKSIVFDLDDTLLQTNLYYKKHMLNMSENVARLIGANDVKETARTIQMEGVRIHKQEAHPMLVNLLMKKSIMNIYGENFQNSKEVFEYIDNVGESFYKGSPILKDGTLPVLDMVNMKGILIGIYSHAQREWTRIKVEYIQNEYRREYERDIKIEYYCTSIESNKDREGWESALEAFGFNKTDTMIVGDNLRDDAIPAQEIGIKNVVLITNSKYSNNVEHNGSGILKIEDLEDLLTL